jgi:hypothetical protein
MKSASSFAAVAVLLVAFGSTLKPPQAAAQAARTCDRGCLRGFITRYLDALIAHNPRTLELASNLRFTEDAKEAQLGETALWKNATKLRTYRLDILDVRQSVAVSQVVVEESGMPAMLALRLKIADDKISEVETQVTRSQGDGALFDVNALQVPNKVMILAPEASQRVSREEAIRIAEFYPAGQKIGGSFAAVDAPFAPDAYRFENGRLTAGPGARAGSENIKTQRIIAHPAITHRVMAVDEEMGIVLLWMNFGDTGNYGAGNALIVWEAFKVYGGQIRAVEAFMKVLPASTKSGWDAK